MAKPAQIGVIVKGKPTMKHFVSLQLLGYKPEDKGDRFEIPCKGFVTEVNLQADPDALKKVVAKKLLLTYDTVITFADGRVRWGLMACTMLRMQSCLVAHDKAKLAARAEEAKKELAGSLTELLS